MEYLHLTSNFKCFGALEEALCEGYTVRMRTEKALSHGRQGHPSYHLSPWHDASLCGLTVTLCLSTSPSGPKCSLPHIVPLRAAKEPEPPWSLFLRSKPRILPVTPHISWWYCGWFQQSSGACLIPGLESVHSNPLTICGWSLPTSRTEPASFSLSSYHLLPVSDLWLVQVSATKHSRPCSEPTLPGVPLSECPGKSYLLATAYSWGVEDSIVWEAGRRNLLSQTQPPLHEAFGGAPIWLGWRLKFI